MNRANFGKIKTKDRNFHARGSRDFGKIRLKIEGGGGGCLGVKIEILPQLLMSLLRLHQIDFVFPVKGWLSFCPIFEEKKRNLVIRFFFRGDQTVIQIFERRSG